jgi:nicotinamide mononucleotide (NMN) deamidase PncC
MRYLMEYAVAPYLKKRLGPRDVLVTRVLRTVAMGESTIDRAIADLQTSQNPTVGLSAHPGQTDVRIVAKAATEAEAESLIKDVEAQIRERLGAAIYATGDPEGPTLEAALAELLRERQATVAVAETLTRGEILRRLCAHPDICLGGLVAADGPALARLLGEDVVVAEGEQGAILLAERIQKSVGSTFGLAVVGDAEERAWVAVAGLKGTETRRLRFAGSDLRARTWTTTLALEFIRRLLLGLAEGWAG